MDQFDFNVEDFFECHGQDVLIPSEITETIVELEARIKELQTAEDELKRKILNEMQRKGLLRVVNEDVIITRVPGHVEEYFNEAQLKAEKPDLWNKYICSRTVKPTVSIKIK